MASPPVALPPDVARWLRAGVALMTALILLQVLWEADPGAGAPRRLVAGAEGAAAGAGLAGARARQPAGALRRAAAAAALYFAEAMTRAVAESGRHALVAGAAAALTAAAFAALLQSFRAAKRHRLG